MTFVEAMRRYDELNTHRQSGQISYGQFVQAVNQLRVQDASGGWWQIDPSTGGWMTWDGASWVPALPPRTQVVEERGSRTPGTREGAVSGWQDLRQQVMSPDQFLKEAKQKPIARRSQRWWDVLSVVGGIVGAAIWFLYSSIRGSYESYDLITPAIMVMIPTALVLFRKRIDSLLLPLHKYKKRIPRMVLVGAGLAVPLVVPQLLWNVGQKYKQYALLTNLLKEYSYLRLSIIIGTTVSYVIMRTPQGPQRRTQA